MIWFFAAIAGAATHAVANFIDKYVLEKQISDYKIVPIYTALVSLIVGSILWIVTGFPVLSLSDGLVVLITGALSTWALMLYFKALTIEETSNVIILFQMIPIITLIFSFLFLRETISFQQFIGFIFILSATVLVSIKKIGETRLFSRAFYYILMFDILSAATAILIKYTITTNSFGDVVAWESWGLALGGFSIYLLVPSIRKAFSKSVRTIRKRTIGILAFNDLLFIAGKLLFFFAFSLGSVALVKVLEGTQAFFGILYGLIFTSMYPSVFREKITKKAIVHKFIAVLLLFEGIILIS